MSTIEMNVFEVPEFFWVKYGSGIPVKIRTADIRNVIELVEATKKKLFPLMDNVAVSQLTLSLPVGITRAVSGLDEDAFMHERPDATLDPGCPLNALVKLNVTSKHPLVIKVIKPSDEEVGNHTSSSYYID